MKKTKPKRPVKKTAVKKVAIKKSVPQKAATTRTATAQKEYTFFEDVWEVVRQIPKGRVTSYGAIANYLGTKLSARMVGWAMNAASLAKPKIPAQRVVNRLGMLSGKMHFKTPGEMQRLLEKDGVRVENDRVLNFADRFWDPLTELGL